MANYTFLDAYASVQTAEASVVGANNLLRPIIAGTFTGNPSISGQVGASIIGLTPVAVTNIPSISGQVGASVIGTVPITQAGPIFASISGQAGASIIGTVPVTQVGAWSASLVGVIPGSVVAFQGGNWNIAGSVAAVQNGAWTTSIVAANPLPVAGSVAAFLQGNASVITIWSPPSIVGTYAEDATHTSADKGLFVLGVRNDTVASFAGSNTEYSPIAVDSAGRAITKPFAPDQAAVRGIASNVGTSVTSLLPAAGTGLRNYITDLIAVNTGAATAAVNLRDSDASIIARIIVPTGGGSNMQGLATPIRTGSLNSHVDMVPLTPSSIITITALGYIAP